jgi:hypothetical protein
MITHVSTDYVDPCSDPSNIVTTVPLARSKKNARAISYIRNQISFFVKSEKYFYPSSKYSITVDYE